MKAIAFLKSLHDVIPENYPKRNARRGVQPYIGADWTAWMTEQLHNVARVNELSCCCSDDKHTEHFSTADEGQTRGYKKEYLFDLTWYRRWGWNHLPDVIIEHENIGTWTAFLEDHWKLMVGYAPLRVSFGYNKDPHELASYADKLNEVSHSCGWKFPDGIEDISLLGHVNMAPREFQVLHRPDQANVWTNLGSIADAVRRLS